MPTQDKKRKRSTPPKAANGNLRLVLVEDVPNVGHSGDLVEVRPGFGRNYLIPQGLAMPVSAHNFRLLERHKVRVTQAREARLADLRVLAEQIKRVTNQTPVTIEATANEDGHLYGSVTAPEISRGLKAMNLNVDPEAVRLEGPIKEVGLYAVKLHLAGDIESEARVLVHVGAGEKK